MELEKNHSRSVLRNLTPQDFLGFGMDHIGYIRPVEAGTENQAGYALYAANGTLLSVQETFDIIVMLAHENDIQPVTVH